MATDPLRAVWSYWSAPYGAHRAGAWGTERNHLLAWALSFETARRHHRTTSLVTDTAGAALLVDALGLEFDEVSLGLDQLHDVDPTWWTVGKFLAVAEQERPFVHLDADVFCWQPLPAALLAAPVFTQNPEPFRIGDNGYYRPELIEAALTGDAETWLPDAWTWYRRPEVRPRGECCGIVGGTDVDLLQEWATQGLRLLRDPANADGLAALPDRPSLMITVEQYLLAAHVETRHRRAGTSTHPPMSYLFASWAEAADPRRAAERGFTHLIADTKGDPTNVQRLARRVAREHPDRYARVLDITTADDATDRAA